MTRISIPFLVACLVISPLAAQERSLPYKVDGATTFSNEREPLEKSPAQTFVSAARSACQRHCRDQNPACVGKSLTTDGPCASQLLACLTGCEACVLGETAICASSEGNQAEERCSIAFVACIKKEIAARSAPQRQVRFGGGDGSSRDSAVVILNAEGELEGVYAETFWLSVHHPKWEKTAQFTTHDASRKYDGIVFHTPEGERTVWFDITSFFGKGSLFGKGGLLEQGGAH